MCTPMRSHMICTSSTVMLYLLTNACSTSFSEIADRSFSMRWFCIFAVRPGIFDGGAAGVGSFSESAFPSATGSPAKAPPVDPLRDAQACPLALSRASSSDCVTRWPLGLSSPGVTFRLIAPLSPTRVAKGVKESEWGLARFLRLIAAFSARCRMSRIVNGRSAKSSSSASSSKISAFWAAVTGPRFWLVMSSFWRLIEHGNSCARSSGCAAAFTFFGASCTICARAVGGKQLSFSLCGTRSRNLPRAFSAQDNHTGMSCGLNSNGSCGMSDAVMNPLFCLIRSNSRWIRRHTFSKKGENC
mmetsp:Transcript_26832/g.77586  ORF Transcript_26832/g.77586 Transcript_26832/m.77586 type:complete len:301 (-) Transcript_26832:1291-2193(-)